MGNDRIGSRQEAFRQLMQMIKAAHAQWQAGVGRTRGPRNLEALVWAANDMEDLSGGGSPDVMLTLTEPELCAELAALTRIYLP